MLLEFQNAVEWVKRKETNLEGQCWRKVADPGHWKLLGKSKGSYGRMWTILSYSLCWCNLKDNGAWLPRHRIIFREVLDGFAAHLEWGRVSFLIVSRRTSHRRLTLDVSEETKKWTDIIHHLLRAGLGLLLILQVEWWVRRTYSWS